MNVAELIELLEAIEDKNAEIRLATQPSWPFEHTIDKLVTINMADDDRLDDDVLATLDPADRASYDEHIKSVDKNIVYIGQGRHLGYLSGVAQNALDW